MTDTLMPAKLIQHPSILQDVKVQKGNTSTPIIKIEAIEQILSFKSLFCILAIGFFTIQPWDHFTADALWVLLSLSSLIYVISKKITGHDFKTPKQLQSIYYLLILIPTVSVISYLASPLNTLTPDLLEPDTRWLLVIPIIMAMRDTKTGAYWILAMLSSYSISTFISATIETHYFSHIGIRANGDENAVSYGMFNATIALLLLGYFVDPFLKEKLKNKNLFIVIRTTIMILFFTATVATFLSGTRAAMALIPIGISLIYWQNYNKLKAIIGITILISVVIVAALIFSKSALVQRLIIAPERVASYFTVHDKSSRLKNQRLEQWSESWCIFKFHPLTGTGPRSFKQAHEAYGGSKHCDALQNLPQGSYQAHSLYFNTIGTLGLFGLLPITLLFLFLFKTSIITKRSEFSHIKLGGNLLLITVISHLINGVTLDLLFRNHIMDKFLMVIALPILLIFNTENLKDPSNKVKNG